MTSYTLPYTAQEIVTLLTSIGNKINQDDIDSDLVNPSATNVPSTKLLQEVVDLLKTSYNKMLLSKPSASPYTLQLTDAGMCVEMNFATSNTVKIPNDSNVNFEIGTVIVVRQMNSGQTSITVEAGVTLNNPSSSSSLSSKYSVVSLHKRAKNEWCLSGETSI